MFSSPKSYKLLSLHPGRQHNLEQAAVLAELYKDDFRHVTSLYVAPEYVTRLHAISPRYAGKLAKRSYSKLPAKYVFSITQTELRKISYQLRNKTVDYFSLNENFQYNVLKRFAPPQICISPDTASSVIFKNWKGKSKLVLDLTIGVPQYRQKIQYGDQFTWQMLQDVTPLNKRLFQLYKNETELADIILCGSEFVRDTVSWLNPAHEAKCRVLPYGVDLEDFGCPDRQFVEKKNLQFVFVGTVCWRKGADLLLKAWESFVAFHPGCELHFFGGIDNHIDLSLIPSNVHMHGMVDRRTLVEQLKKMDVFVFPTTFEGSAIAVFQAMAMQLPIVTTANSGTVLNHGTSCEMIEVGSISAITNALEKLYGDLAYRKSIAFHAYNLSTQYSWEHYKNKLNQILNDNDEVKNQGQLPKELQVAVGM